MTTNIERRRNLTGSIEVRNYGLQGLEVRSDTDSTGQRATLKGLAC